MRTILFALYLIFVMIISLPLYPVVYFTGKSDKMKMHKLSQKIVRHFLKRLLWISGVKVNVSGLSNILKMKLFFM